MTTATASILELPAPAHAATRGPSLRTYVLETKYEFYKLLRTPHYSVPVRAFPVMFYLLFGLSFAGRTRPGVGGPARLWNGRIRRGVRRRGRTRAPREQDGQDRRMQPLPHLNHV